MSSTSRKRSHEDPSPRPRRPLQREVSGTDHLAVLEALNLPVSLITPQYTYKWVNSCYSAAQGKKPEEIIGRTVRDLWGETFDKTIKGHLDRCFQGAEVRAKAWVRYPAHGPRYCEIVYSPYCPDGKSAVSAIVVAYDTTDRKEMEERLSQSEQRFRDLSEASLEAIVFIEGGVIADANKAVTRLFGYEGIEVRGKLATDFVSPEERALAEQRIQTGTEGRYETVGLRRDGSRFSMEVNSREFRTNGRRLRIAAIRDLTERKAMERQLKAHQEDLEKLVRERTEELKKSEEKFRAIFENATEGIFQIAPDGRCLSINPAFAHIHGYATPDDFAAEITDITQLHVEPERRREYIELLHKEGHVHNFEFQVYRRDRTITWVSVNARAVRDESGAVLYREGTVQDISQRKQAEEALEAKSQSLEEANTALKVLLEHRDADRKELEEKFVSNIRQLVLPYVQKLKQGKLEPLQQIAADFVEANLEQILSPFLNNLRSFNFTPRQLETIALLKEGRTTKEIAALLHVNKEAIDMQRFLIRKKLGVNKGKTNLRSYLLSLS